jgi:hypothetical protein
VTGPSVEAGVAAEDAELWWQDYLLAENNQADELRRRAKSGDDHARRQLASWLGDRGRTGEAIEVVRPLADAGDDVAELWLARWLATGDDHLDELRDRAASGSYHALNELAERLMWDERLDELRELVTSHREQLSPWLARQGNMSVVHLAAELGDDDARRRLRGWLGRLAERAASGSEHAREILAENPDWQRYLDQQPT